MPMLIVLEYRRGLARAELLGLVRSDVQRDVRIAFLTCNGTFSGIHGEAHIVTVGQALQQHVHRRVLMSMRLVFDCRGERFLTAESGAVLHVFEGGAISGIDRLGRAVSCSLFYVATNVDEETINAMFARMSELMRVHRRVSLVPMLVDLNLFEWLVL